MSLISTEWLEKNISNVKIVDGSWHMPATNRSGKEEFNKEHIPNAIFFDIDENCNKSTDLPHMLTDVSRGKIYYHLWAYLTKTKL